MGTAFFSIGLAAAGTAYAAPAKAAGTGAVQAAHRPAQSYGPGVTWSVEQLDAAKELLLNSDCSISEIAEQLNYANTQNFIRFFSKYENTTPGRYRKEHKKEDSASESDNKQDPE